ncbi:VPS10 domain-containing protein [Saccharicrinis aurantiacus]|uniref:VPS10 domain-containing protein n=1 Tax=Saccharicrinis aurantiacus TaxID=1849719 RepID=UPI00095001B7|nr:hypothetical protein [Saccharicrinis aurantiacus]
MKSYLNLNLLAVLFLFLGIHIQAQTSTINAYERPTKFDALEWRFIGPMIGTRGSVVLGHPTEPYTFFHGAGNGLWKTEDAGVYWEPVGDDDFNYGSIGAMEFSESNPKIAYVGLGEPQMRNNVSWGDGVYKSTDGGDNWTHVGLKNVKHISQVRVHPKNPDVVFVGAFGDAFGPNEDRGVYRTKDGGKTWEQVLFKSEKAGVIDLVMNPSNPDELFAVMWEFERKAWGPKTGGPESGMYKSTDGGDTWTEITYNNGLPAKGRGRTGITMSAADAKKIYALIDSETKPGLYVSNDLGENWEFVSDFFQIIGRPFYYSHIMASPHDAKVLWCPNNRTFSSNDGGKTWELQPGIKDDFHDFWICPKDPNRIIGTNDGGCQVSMTGGKTWSSQYTQKTAQFYRVNVDNDFPYNVYGSGQDVLAYKVPSASRWGGISGYETTIIGNGEISSVIPNPDDLNIVYNISGGSPMGSGAPFTVNNIATGQNEVRSVWPVPLFGLNGYDLKYRFNWDLAYFLSPHDSKTIYLGGNVLFKTTDEGLTWEVISPDLTNDLKERQKITGTPWLSEYFGQEIYSTIKRMDESPVKQGVIWTGSDDGRIHVTKDGGANWTDISIKDKYLPKYSQVYEIEPSPYDAATAYVVFSNFNTYNDYKPYIYKTTDYGQTWVNLSENFPQTEISRTIREDKVRKGLLFVGTENGVYYSLNDGKSWDKLKANLPAVPVVDMKVKDNDLVIATNGRGFWIMDDITPLRELRTESDKKSVHLYPIPDYTRFGYNWWLDYVPGGDPGTKKNYFVQNMRPGLTYYEETFKLVNGERKRKFIDAGDPKPLGPVFYFKLEKEPKEIAIQILNKDGKVIRNYGKAEMMLNYGKEDDFNSGLNKFVWDMRIDMLPRVPTRPPTAIMPIVPPGEYQVKLLVDGTTETQNFKINMSPKENYTQAQADAKFEFWMEMYNEAAQMTDNVIQALQVRDEAKEKLETLKTSGASAGTIKKAQKQYDIIASTVNNYEAAFVSTGRTLAEVINLPATLLFKMSFMSGILDHSEGPVSESMKVEYQGVLNDAKKADASYKKNIEPQLAKFNKLLK